MHPPADTDPEKDAAMLAEAALAPSRPRTLPPGLARLPTEHLAFAGRLLAFTYDDRGRCDGFVLELQGGEERCFETREPGIEAALRRALASGARMTILTAAAQPRRPLAILPGED
ncbi:MAG: hypothetical protein M0002_14965 [Rhodospirillales bacterium]|nr:hypothetical protein [Rhodospirillales bacterium]